MTPAEGIYKKKLNYIQTGSNRTFARNNKCLADLKLFRVNIPPEK